MTISVPDLSAPLASHPLAELFERCGPLHFAEEPLYTPLCRLIARSPILLDWLDAAPAGQRRPNLILAALHDAVLAEAAARPGEPPEGLAAWYGSVGGQRPPHDPALPDALAAFAQRHETTLRHHLATRRTQTNEVGRCAVLRPALDAIARRHGPRLALFDLGCSAGLNLTVDQQHIRYTQGEHRWLAGPAGVDAPDTITLTCEWLPSATAPGPAPTPRPRVDWQLLARAGCDPAPVRLDDAGALRWLHACLWPADVLRRQRLDHAVQCARALAPPVHAAADGLAVLSDWLAQLPPQTTPVLFNSWVLAYFSAAELAAHRQRVMVLVQQRGLVWLSAEDARITRQLGGLSLPDPASPGAPRGGPDTDTWWHLTEPRAAGPGHRLLARSHPHGAWLQWLDDSAPPQPGP